MAKEIVKKSLQEKGTAISKTVNEAMELANVKLTAIKELIGAGKGVLEKAVDQIGNTLRHREDKTTEVENHLIDAMQDDDSKNKYLAKILSSKELHNTIKFGMGCLTVLGGAIITGLIVDKALDRRPAPNA